jgi:transposase
MISITRRVDAYSGIQRRRRCNVDEKLRILPEASRAGITNSYAARQHGTSPSLLFHWKRCMAVGGKYAIRVDEDVAGSSEVKAPENRIRELEPVLDKKTLENDILRQAVKVFHQKHCSSAADCPTRVRCEDRSR